MDVRRRILNGIISGSSGGSTAIDTDNYLTIYALEDGLTAKLSTNACEYCIDGDGNWLSLSAGATTQSINTGHRLSFRGELTPASSKGIGTFTISKKCNLEGNCMSMLFGDNAVNNLSLSGKNYAFYNLFNGCTNVVEVSEGFLPATTLAVQCYYCMFYGCSSLTTAPVLPATTLVGYCYEAMFHGCSSLTTAPELPATTLATYCYENMFYNCSGLTTAPALPATTLATYCYYGMFYNCTSLTTAPVLPATTLADGCCREMFYGCKGLTIAPALPATTLASYCYYRMFYGCSKLTSVPALPATTLASYCYSYMFRGCSSLTTAPALPATTLTDYCYQYMFYGCSGLTSAPELPATTLTDYCYQYMFYGCSKLNYIKMLATNISATNCLYAWVNGVASTGTFVKAASMTSLPTGNSGIPSGWTVVDDSSESNATDNYLTIYALEDGLTASLSTNTCEYCVDGDGNWKSLAAGTATESINAGHRLSFRGNLSSNSINGIGTFTISKRCNLEGNCMSMLFGDNAGDNYSLSGYEYVFNKLFYNCTNIVEVSEGFLPATTLEHACYFDMFYGCSSLTTAPALPATTLSGVCYRGMFGYCTSLTTAPALPATTLASDCYCEMFRGCSSLTTSPSLPATTLANECYYCMFNGCTSLTTAPALPATTLTEICYSYMFYNCTSLTTAPALPATTLAEGCYSGMFTFCTKLTTAPTLPATTLTTDCYREMFGNCYELNYIKMLATDISASNCLYRWVDSVPSTGTFVKNPNMTSLPTGTSGIPSGWTVQDDYTPTSCTSLTITADDVSGKDTTTTIYYTAVTNGKDSSGNIINNVTITGTATSASFPQNTSTTNTVQRTISYTYLGKTATTTITQGVWVNSQYTVNLNSQWQKSSTISNPDASLYDGVYESFSNYNIGNTAAIMKITIDGYSSFKFYIRSNAESNFDYVMVSQLDQTIDNNTSYSNTTLVKAHTRGNQQSGTALSNYTPVEFTNINGGKHVITVVYRKDGSANNGTDRGYVLIPKMAGDSSGSGGDSGESTNDILNNYMTIVALEDNLTVTYTTATYKSNYCEYCVDGDGNWLSLKSNSTTQSVNTGHTLSFKNTVSKTHMQGYTPGVGTFSISKKCNLEGNCMSMVFGDNGSNTTSLVGRDYAFYKLFSDCTNIIEVSDNLLPATTLGTACYSYMFNNCSNLTKAPCLPATTTNCLNYKYMFYGCSSMITPPPSLPATTIGTEEYYAMFYNCSSLTTSPRIMVETFNHNYYDIGNNLQSMFYGCSSLNKIYLLTTSIPSETKSYAVFSNWVNGVASTGTFIKSSSLTDLTYLPTGNSGIPSGWTVINHLITFTINGTEYQVEEGMTWEEFINSEYNISGHFTSHYGSAVKYKGNMIYRSIEGGIQSVSVIDLIVKSGMYVY